MKNLFNAAGILTAGLASLALSTSLHGQDTSKRWNVGLGARGFFDDNIFTRPDVTVNGEDLRKSSFGIDVSPSLGYNLQLGDQGSLDLGYTYGVRWFENRPGDDIDQYHNFNAALNHQFSPRYKLAVNETFAIAQEPEQLSSGLPFRSEGDNIHNNAGVLFTAGLAGALSGELGYSNNYYDYDNAGYKQALNRLDHLITANLRYQFRPTTAGILGYQYRIADYTSNLKTTTTVGTNTYVFNPQSKDQNSHFIYGGADHNFTSQLLGSVRVGVQITEWDRYDATGSKGGGSRSSASPYADASLSYAYAEKSNIRVGVKHQRTATDLFTLVNATNPVLDTESTTAYVQVTQKITSKLNISGTALFQSSDFEAPGTDLDGESEQYWNFGVTLSYQFTRWLAGEASYYYDNLSSSDLVAFREYDRNRVFLGVRFSY